MNTRKIPSAREMEQSRKTLYFRDEHDTQIAVTVELLPNGEWSAELADENDIRTLAGRGYGETMLEAIADLNELLADVEPAR